MRIVGRMMLIWREGVFQDCDFRGTDFFNALTGNTDFRGADFRGARAYRIDVRDNELKGTKFSRFEAMSLLEGLGI